jgi:hypothetical protein
VRERCPAAGPRRRLLAIRRSGASALIAGSRSLRGAVATWAWTEAAPSRMSRPMALLRLTLSAC